MQREFPAIDIAAATPTRDALHAYARVLGDCLKAHRTKRKHWWHASLRPSLSGLTTGVIRGDQDIELELDMRNSALHINVSNGERHSESLTGQSVADLVAAMTRFLTASGVGDVLKLAAADEPEQSVLFEDYSAEHADVMQRILADVVACMTELRAYVREESSPIQLWPHHFDLSMLWLPGDKIADQDPDNEEYADKQMNVGFAFGDAGIPEPYFYITAYPLPDEMANATLPAGAQWKSDGFSGAVLTYARLREEASPTAYLLGLWRMLHDAGKASLMKPA